jgi:cellulose synthase/poly-beta-1,6-N-acetylglucosamine synthase-like glycosyltransferase
MDVFDSVLSYMLLSILLLTVVFWLIVYFDTFDSEDNRKKMKKYPKVAVIIPTLFEGRFLRNSVESVIASDYPKDKYNIYIGLNERTDELTRKTAYSLKRKNVTVVDTHLNGKSRVMNYVIKNSLKDERFILSLDADSVIDKDLINKLVIPFFEKKKVGMVAPSMLIYKPKKALEMIQKYEYLFNIALRKGLSLLSTLLVAPGPGSMISRSALEKAGYYDENNITEDMELTMRMLINGYRIENRLDAISYTLAPKSIPTLMRQRFRWYSGSFFNMIKYRKQLVVKREDENIDRGVISLILISSGLSLLALPILGYYIYLYLSKLIFLLSQVGLKFTLSYQSFINFLFSFNELSFIGIMTLIIAIYSMFYILKRINGKISIVKDGFWSVIFILFYGYLLAIAWTAGFLNSLRLINKVNGT